MKPLGSQQKSGGTGDLVGVGLPGVGFPVGIFVAVGWTP